MKMTRLATRPPFPGRHCLTCPAVAPADSPTTYWARYPAGWLCAACNRALEAAPLLARVALGHGWWLLKTSD